MIPLKPGGFEIDGMAELTRQVESVRRVSPSVRIAGVLLTMWYNDPDIIGVEDWLRKNSGQRVFNSHIRLSRPVDKSVLGGEADLPMVAHLGRGTGLPRMGAGVPGRCGRWRNGLT